MGATPASEEAGSPAELLSDIRKQPDSAGQEPAERETALNHERQATQILLEKVLANVNDYFAFLDGQWRYTYVNDAAARVIGLPRERLIGECIWELLPELVGTPLHQAAQRAFAEQRAVVFEEFYAPWGRWYENHISGFPYGVSIYSIDISTRKEAERALRASEERFSKAFYASPQAMCITNIEDGSLVDCNESFARMVAYTRDEVIGRTSCDIGIWTSAEARQRTNAKIIKEGGTDFFEHRFTDHNGMVHDIISSGQLIELEEKPYILSVANDITEKKRTEVALRESEEKFAKVFHSSPLVISITRLSDGRLIEVNETFVQLTGYTREEAIGRTPIELGFWVIPERRGEGLAQLRDGSFVRNREERFRLKDGRIITCLISAEIIEINSEKCVVTVINDISERKQAEEALRQMNLLLEQRVEERTADLLRSNVELDQFAYVASHDLKAPLRSIALLTTWIQEDAARVLPPSSKVHFEKLQQRVTRMETLLNDLLAYSRAGRQRHKPQRVESGVLIGQIVDLLGFPADFVVSVREPMPVLYTEQVALEVVLRNLLNNTFKHHHSPQAGHVWVSAREEGEWIEFCVTDDGPGIDPQFHQRIFGIFQTLRPRDEVEGSGIGLALVKRLVEMRGGVIQIESALGEGATFRFTWPKHTAPPAES
jgi:PAS domain S-box-containing protein